MIKIWGRRSSANVQKVLWLADELGVAYEHIAVGGKFGGLDEPGFRALNPHGRIPVIQDNDLTVWESHAILRYLAARYGKGTFWPEDAAARSQIDEWVDWSQTAFQPDFLNGVFWGFYRTPETQRDWPSIRKSVQRCGDHARLLDTVLNQRHYLGGNNFSLADIPVGSLLYRYFELEIERPSAPHVEAWYGRLQMRPAYRQHVMVAFDELRGRLAY